MPRYARVQDGVIVQVIGDVPDKAPEPPAAPEPPKATPEETRSGITVQVVDDDAVVGDKIDKKASKAK